MFGRSSFYVLIATSEEQILETIIMCSVAVIQKKDQPKKQGWTLQGPSSILCQRDGYWEGNSRGIQMRLRVFEWLEDLAWASYIPDMCQLPRTAKMPHPFQSTYQREKDQCFKHRNLRGINFRTTLSLFYFRPKLKWLLVFFFQGVSWSMWHFLK